MHEEDLKFAASSYISITQDILTLNEWFWVVDRLKMNAKVVKAAGVFFHHQNTFLYPESVL